MTLTQTAIVVKQIIVISIIFSVLGLVSLVGYNLWHAYYLAHLPPVEEKPDMKFGILPPPDFPKGKVTPTNFSYSLDTTTGGLPKVGSDIGFEKIIKVYFVTQTVTTLLSSDRSQALAEKFNISNPPEYLSETKYRFANQNKALLVNLDNGNFSYINEATTSATSLDNDNKLVLDFYQFLSSLGVMKNDLRNGRSKIIWLKKDGVFFNPVATHSEADAAQISIWPATIDKKQIFTPEFNKSLINATVVSSASGLDNYLSLNFTNYLIDTTTFATYLLKTAEVAFDDLKQGKGVIAIEPGSPQVSITSVELGYYLSENYTPYLQPIYIFEGPNFAAYISAIGEQFQSQGH